MSGPFLRLERARPVVAILALAAALGGCVYDFDAYEVAEGAGGSSSSSTGGGATSSTTSTTSSSVGGGGAGGAGGAGGGGPLMPLPPCTPAYDFEDFSPYSGDWDADYEVRAEDGNGDAYAYVRASGDGYAGFWWDTRVSPQLCFQSIRVELVGGTNHGLFAYCDGGLGMSVRYEAPTGYAYTTYADSTGIPDGAGLDLGGRTLEGFRLSFGESSLLSEIRADGEWVKVDEIPLPAWLVDCELGYDMYVETDDASHVDDWCADPPPTSLVALP